MNKATLFIVATPIGNLNELSFRALDVLKKVSLIACEDTRNTRKLLAHYDIHTRMKAYHNFNEEEAAENIVSFLDQGEDVALVSDAGYPLISDPGYELVQKTLMHGHQIVPVSGANAALNALVGSGLKTDHFLFYGFLNSTKSKAKKEAEALKNIPYTLIFYEAPHRIKRTLQLLYEVYGDRQAVVVREITKLHEEYLRGSLSSLMNIEEFKGELVLLVEGFKESEEIVLDNNILFKEIKQEIKKGLRTKEAIKIVAEKYHCSRSQLYNDYLKENRKED